MTTINYLTRIEFDFGAIDRLSEILGELGVHRPLIVTDAGLLAHGLVDKLRAAAPALAEVSIYSETPSNPTEDAATAALGIYRAGDCDGLVAFGGGSPIDLAKAVALLATHDGPLSQYAAIEGGVGRIRLVAPLVAVPTTAGTGSEVGRAALITLRDGRKLGLISPHLIPQAAICDPELTMGLPPGLTAATGLDAISHCVETFLSPRVNPVADAIALDGLERAVSAVRRATADGSDRAARWEMMMAALQGGLTFQKGLGGIHALSHPLGAIPYISLHHGALNAVLLPHVLEANAPDCEDKLARMASRLGLAEGASLAKYFSDLNAELGLPSTLGEMGLRREDLPAIADAAVKDHSAASNPRVLSSAEYLAILEAAF